MLSILHNKISTICPIHGVSIGKQEDISTWSISFKDEATKEQKDQAQQILQTFSFEEEEIKQQKKKEALEFLQNTDIKILRRIEEQALGQTPALTSEQYRQMLTDRQTKRLDLKD